MDHTALAAVWAHHLADLGHRAIAIVNRPERLLRTGYESVRRGLDGVTKAAAERGLTVRTYLCGDDAFRGLACLERILHEDPATTALVTLNEAALGGLYGAWPGRAVMRRATSRSSSASPSDGPDGDSAAHRGGRAGGADGPPRRRAARTPDAPARHHLLAPPISFRPSTGPLEGLTGRLLHPLTPGIVPSLPHIPFPPPGERPSADCAALLGRGPAPPSPWHAYAQNQRNVP